MATQTFRVEHKWSLFSRDRPTWEEYGGGPFLAALDALPMGDQIDLSLASRKEIRYGEVRIKRTPKGYTASGTFRELWDDAPGVADTLGLADMRLGSLIELLPYTQGPDPHPGVEVEFADVTADTADALLVLLDLYEEELIDASGARWREVEAFAREHRDRRRRAAAATPADGDPPLTANW